MTQPPSKDPDLAHLTFVFLKIFWAVELTVDVLDQVADKVFIDEDEDTRLALGKQLVTARMRLHEALNYLKDPTGEADDDAC